MKASMNYKKNTIYSRLGKLLCGGMFLLAFFCGVPLSAQSINGTQQLENLGFEQYDNLGKESVEPVGWNSFLTANSAGGLIDMGKEQRMDRAVGGRPGSAGLYSLYVFSNSIFGVNANGNVTTGRINMGSTTASSSSNYNFTDRGSAGFNVPFTVVPDSMVVWVKYTPKESASDEGQIKAIIHNDNNTIDPGTNMNQAVAIATVNPVKGSGGWVRYSVPFSRQGCGSNDPRYVLVSITTNKVPGGGLADMWVDDILFIYNPELKMGDLPALSFNLRYGAAQFEIPFTITGTIEPNSNSTTANQVIAELSDMQGSFANPVQIGRMNTDQSGSIAVSIPAETALGTGYRIRLRSTATPLQTPDNGQDITLMRGFTIQSVCNANQGKVTGAGAYQEGSEATLTAVPLTGYHFVCWKENGVVIPGAGSVYTFSVTKDRTIEAVFELNSHTLTLSVEGEGEVTPEPGQYTYLYNDRVTLQATPHANNAFKGFYENEVMVSNNPVYAFNMTSDRRIVARFEPGKLDVMVSVNDKSLGSVSGIGLYPYGSQVTLTATPMPFCDFVAWLDGKDTVGKETTYTFTVSENRLLTAVFSARYYQVELAASPAEGGTLKGAGRFSATQSNTTIEISAQPNTGYDFLYWKSDSEDRQIEDNPYRVLEDGRLLENLRYTAYFALQVFDIEAEPSPVLGGSVSGSGRYSYGESVSVEAVVAEGYRFVAWVDRNGGKADTLSKDNPFSFNARSDMQIEAVLERTQHTVTTVAQPKNYGTETGSGLYSYGDTARLFAQASSAYEFRFWAVRNGLKIDTVSFLNPYCVPVFNDREYVAVYSLKRKSVAAECRPYDGGTVEGTGLYEDGSYASLLAVPAYGYHFGAWTTRDSVVSGYDNPRRLTARQDTTLFVRFDPDEFAFTVMSEGLLSVGQVAYDQGEYAVRHQAEVYYGQEIEISAQSVDPRYRFIEWRLQYVQEGRQIDTFYSRSSRTVYRVERDASLSAVFAMDAFGIEASVFPSFSAGQVLNTGNYAVGKWVELEAVPAAGYQFAAWTDASGEEVRSDKDVLLIQVLSDTQVYARFETARYELESAAWPSKGGSVTGGGSYLHGETVRFEAQPASGYEFAGWYDSRDTSFSKALSEQEAYAFEAEGEALLLALFKPVVFTIETEVRPLSAGKVQGSGPYPYGSQFRLQAEAAEGYRFAAWLCPDGEGGYDTVYGSLLGGNVESDMRPVALFEKKTVDLQVYAASSLQGSVEIQGSAPYLYGSTVVIQAQAATHYAFSQWVDATGKRISKNSGCEILLTGDSVLYAEFVPATCRLNVEASSSVCGYVLPFDNRPAYGSVVQISAEPMPGYRFCYWAPADDSTVRISTSSLLTWRVEGDTSLTAVFEKADYQVSVRSSVEGAGILNIGLAGQDDTVYSGDFVQAPYRSGLLLDAVACEHYTFEAWEDQGLILSEEKRFSYTVEKDAQITARFEPMMYKVEVSPSSQDCGQVKGGGYFAYGTLVRLEAVPGTGCVFEGWKSGDAVLSQQPVWEIRPDRDTSLVAVFKPDSVYIGLIAGQGGSVNGGGMYPAGQTVEISAVPGQAYRFVQWTDAEGKQVSEENPYRFAAEDPATLTAQFDTRIVGIKVTGTEGGDVEGGGDYAYGSKVDLVASARPGYVFEKWICRQGNIETLQLDLPVLSLSARMETWLEAAFRPESYTVRTQVSPLYAGKVTEGGEFEFGGNLSFEASAASGYQFIGWTKNGEWISDQPLLQVSVDGNATYVAVFLPQKYKILTAAYPSKGALTYGTGSYYAGDTALIEASLYAGYSIKNWTNATFTNMGSERSFLHKVVATDMFTVSLDGSGAGNEGYDGEISEQGSWILYPNPVGSQGEIHIKMDRPQIRNFTLYSLSGKRLLFEEISDTGVSSASISLSDMPKACYLYQIQKTDGTVIRGKLVKM